MRSSLLIVAHAIENALRVLRSSMLPCSRTPLAFIVAHACNRALRSSSLLMLATALCTLIVHSSSLIVAHPIKHINVSSNVRTSCVHPRSSWKTSCVRRCSSMLMLEFALRVLRSSMLPCSRTPCVALRSSSRSCLQQPCAPCCAHSCTLLCTLIVLSSSLNPHRRIIVAHPIEFVALTALTLGLETEADLASLICGAKQLYTPTQRSC